MSAASYLYNGSCQVAKTGFTSNESVKLETHVQTLPVPERLVVI